jgi:hypothetical protein
MVLTCIDDYLSGRRYPLDLLRHMPQEAGSVAMDLRRTDSGPVRLVQRLL